jgi:hypothetical protein
MVSPHLSVAVGVAAATALAPPAASGILFANGEFSLGLVPL